jgi:vacuolar-type H+-ATPase subunit H
MTNTKKKINQVKEQTKTKAQSASKKVKEITKQTVQKLDQAQKSHLGKKIKRVIKKTTKIATAHLATLKTALTLSQQESELIIKLQAELNQHQAYPSKSEIIRAAI